MLQNLEKTFCTICYTIMPKTIIIRLIKIMNKMFWTYCSNSQNTIISLHFTIHTSHYGI